VNLKILPDSNSQLLALEAGEVDVLQNVSLTNCERVEELDGYEVSYCVADTVCYFTWGQQSKLDTDVYLRKAIYAAIDRDAINNTLNRGHTEWVQCMIAPGINCRPDDDTFVQLPDYDVEQAKEYLAQSTYEEGETLSIVVTAGSKEENVCKIIQGNLQAIGINVELKAVDGSMYSTLTTEGNFDITLYSTLPSLYDCNLVYQYYIPGSTRYNNLKGEYKEELGNLAVASLTEMDHDARTEIFRQMFDIINEECLMPTLYRDCNTFCYADYVKGVEAIPGTNVRVAEWGWN
jgi:peptide/nickel transport system substrate-binding protein